jgi:hypothetical protein
LAFVRAFPIGSPVYGDFSAPAQVAILVGQIVVPSLGGPLLGVALGRWIMFVLSWPPQPRSPSTSRPARSST